VTSLDEVIVRATDGLGPTTSVGTVGLVPPTVDIGHTGVVSAWIGRS
jgi:hypothetical protein